MDAPSPSGDDRPSLSQALARAEGWLAKDPPAGAASENGARTGGRPGPARSGFMLWRYLILSAASLALLAHALERMK